MRPGVGLERVERGLQRSEGLRAAHLIPVRRDPVELPPGQPSEERPEPGPANDLVRREPRELPAQASQASANRMRMSAPGCTENVSAALPPLIAIAMFS